MMVYQKEICTGDTLNLFWFLMTVWTFQDRVRRVPSRPGGAEHGPTRHQHAAQTGGGSAGVSGPERTIPENPRWPERQSEAAGRKQGEKSTVKTGNICDKPLNPRFSLQVKVLHNQLLLLHSAVASHSLSCHSFLEQNLRQAEELLNNSGAGAPSWLEESWHNKSNWSDLRVWEFETDAVMWK